ncbi:MAG: hypothetical protein F6K16_14935 [Symploca sp. SIO2B6]|nr:hypothetical protein [Symploca sp. SIO2B6]
MTVTQPHESLPSFFHQYAHQKLSIQDQEVRESLQRRQIPLGRIPRLEEAYKISFDINRNISLNFIENQVLQQIEVAADFIRDFQIGILGQRQGIFQLYEVEIAIDHYLRNTLIFEAGKLSIYIPYCQSRFLGRYLQDQELKKLWNRGKHLAKDSPVRKIWWLFNPIGEFRSNLRASLVLAAQKQILGIDKLFLKFGLTELSDSYTQPPENLAVDDKNSSFKDSVITFLKASVNEEKLGLDLELALKEQDDSKLVQLLNLYRKNLTNSTQMEELIETSALSLQEVIHQEQSQVKIKMFGFVNVGNYHRIDVELNLSSGYLKKYVEIIPRKAEVKAIQFGFVNVYTIDDITVKPSFHSAIKVNFEAAALESALRELFPQDSLLAPK